LQLAFNKKGKIMKPVQILVLRVAALVIGSAVIGASIATNPATAQDVNSMLAAIGLTTCSQSTPCKKYKNNGSGAGLEGVGANGNGLIAQSTNGSATFSTSTNADGVQAYSSNDDGTNSGTNNDSSINPGRSGVWGHDDSTDGGTLNVGVAGSSHNGTGVSGSSGYIGVTGVGNVGVLGVGAIISLDAIGNTGDQTQTVQVAGGTSGDPAGLNLATFQNNGTLAFYVDNNSNAHVNGLIYTNGACSGGCDPTRGDRIASYAAQSSEPILDDIGEGQLQNGVAHVRFDVAFASAINRNARYVVFVSPEGESNGLYVTAKTSEGFTVMENAGGHSTIPFGYRITAKPYGVNAARLPIVSASQMPKMIVPRALAHRHK
jgi:hypothetical protein